MMDALAPDYSGRLLGNWHLLRRLGHGGFGAVYEAENQLIAGRRAALKVLHPFLAADEAMKRRFLNEASAASQADHENIVQVFDGGMTSDGLCFVVMELLRGLSLQQVLSTGHPVIGRVG